MFYITAVEALRFYYKDCGGPWLGTRLFAL